MTFVLSGRLLLFRIAQRVLWENMSRRRSAASAWLSACVFGFAAAVCVTVCLEASHTVYSLAPFLPPDRPIVSHRCAVGENPHQREGCVLGGFIMFFFWCIRNRQTVEKRRRGKICQTTQQKVQVRARLWRPRAAGYMLIRLPLTVAAS